MAHRGQSRALLLRRRGRVQSPAGRVAVCRGTPLSCLDRGYPVLHSISEGGSSQNTTLSHAASTDRKQTVICQLTNRNLCDMFYTLRNTLWQTCISLSQNSGHYQKIRWGAKLSAFFAGVLTTCHGVVKRRRTHPLAAACNARRNY